MPIEPCRVDLPGGRWVELTPSPKGFPSYVHVLYDDGLGNQHPIEDVKIATDHAARTMERQLQLSSNDYRIVMASHMEWSKEMVARLADEARAPNAFPTPPYDLKQRTILQKRDEALSYTEINSWGGMLSVLRKSNLPDDTVLEWRKDAIQYLCCLDLDFHDPSSPEHLTELDLERLGNALSPAPFVWWITQGHGLHALYASSPGDIFTAEELAVGAASQLLMSVPVMRAKGTVELKVKSRHPGALQKGKKCGALRISSQTTEFAVLARFSRAEATDDEAQEFKEKFGFEDGMRLDHSHCRIDPGHVSNGTPIHVGENGLFCHSCEGRLGRGLMTWGFLRRCAGMEVISTRSLAPIREAFEKIVHVEHVDYLFAELFPTLPEGFRRLLYRAQLKAFHSTSTKNREPDAEAMQRVDLAFKPFYFVRGMGAWLHADTLLPAKPLVAADVRVLPSCQQYVEIEGVGEFAQVPSSISAHINNGRIPGWIPIQSYGFEPIFFVHNEEVENSRAVRCRPRVRTTRDRISYTPRDGRMPLAKAEAVISDYFPGINMLYVKALIIASGCAESGIGGVPMLWATGPTEAAKTTTINIVLEMYGETFQNLSGMNEDRLNQVVGDAMHLSRMLVFDDFAKQPSEFQRLHTFVIRLNRNGYTHYKNYVGAETPPFNNAVIFTDWRIPPFFSQDPQFGRRVHLLRLDNRLPIGWDKLGRMVERWWKASPELTQAASALHSWVVDEYFSPGDTEPFNTKMVRLGIPKLEEEANASDTQEAVKELVGQLVTALSESTAAPAEVQRRVGRGARFIDWDNTTDNVGNVCKLLIDSLGKPASGARSRGKHDDRTFYTPDNLRHVLDPFQLHLPKMYQFKDGVTSIEFEIRSWGEASYIRLAEGGRAKRSKARAINDELFVSWPPVLLTPAEDRPVEPVPAAPLVGEPVVQTSSVALAPFVDSGDEELIVIEDEPGTVYPFTAHLDFESQSACDLRKHGSYVYAQHPSTRVVMAAIILKELSPNPPPVRRIFWTLEQYELKMPPGVEYEWGIDFLRDMATDPAGCIIVPHNVGFERPMWEFNLKLPPPMAWRDTMDKALACGFPGGADEAGQALLGLGKDKEGGAFWMSICKPTKRGELPLVNAHVVQKTLNYNFRDSEIGFGITERLGLDMTPPWEQRVCDLHHKINHWGIYIDKDFALKLREFDNEFKALAGDLVERLTFDPEMNTSAIKRTDLTRNDYLRAQLNLQLPPEWQLSNMRQTSLEDLIDAYEEGALDVDPAVIDVIKCRLTVSRASLAKVDKALDCISADGRAKAQLRYWGAGPGRWSGYQIQPQNMKRPDENFDIEAATEAVKSGDKAKFMELCKDQPPYELLGSLTRGILTPAPGSVYVVGDFASIEARALLWLAGDEEGLEEYRRKDAADEAHPEGKDPNVPDTYQTLAGDSIFGKDPITVTKKERGGGKIGILACGYGGGAGAVERMALPLGVDLAAINKTPQDIVDAFRSKYPKVKAYWYECDNAFRTVLMSRRTTVVKVGRVTFRKLADRVEIVLPSGRAITYMNARLEKDERSFHQSGTSITYDKALRKKVVPCRTHGAKIVENIVQGFCRDLLADVMLRVDDAGAPIAFHVHDEDILEVMAEHGDAWRDWLQTCMRTAPEWAQGMPVFSKPEVMKERYGK